MIGKGTGIRKGKTLCLGEASIENEDRSLLIHGTVTLKILRDLEIQGAPKWPPRLLDEGGF